MLEKPDDPSCVCVCSAIWVASLAAASGAQQLKAIEASTLSGGYRTMESWASRSSPALMTGGTRLTASPQQQRSRYKRRPFRPRGPRPAHATLWSASQDAHGIAGVTANFGPPPHTPENLQFVNSYILVGFPEKQANGPKNRTQKKPLLFRKSLQIIYLAHLAGWGGSLNLVSKES